MSKNYEVTAAISLSVSPDNRTKVIEAIKKLITDLKGKITSSDSWGEKPLAYRIKQDDSALFHHFAIELDPSGVNELSNRLKLTDGVIRSLIVLSE